MINRLNLQRIRLSHIEYLHKSSVFVHDKFVIQVHKFVALAFGAQTAMVGRNSSNAHMYYTLLDSKKTVVDGSEWHRYNGAITT